MHAGTIGNSPDVCQALKEQGVTLKPDDLLCENLITFAPAIQLAPLADITPHDWKKSFDRWAKDTFFAARTWLESAIERKSGTWVAVTSTVALRPFFEAGSSGSAAVALQTLVQVAAIEGGPAGVRANVIAEGWSGELPTTLDHELAVNDTPLHRLAQSEDVAAAIKWLLSPAAAHVTGAVVPVDGGYSLTRGSRPNPLVP